MANLLLYSGITPNSNNIHYLYDNIATFKTTLQSYLLKTVNIDNYRINAGIIKVKIDETLTTSNYKNVTYAINEKDNMCYIVKSGILQSDFVIYDCDVDYWGTYIAQASFSHINVLRCNRNIDIGIYDDIKATKNNVKTVFDIPAGEYVIDNTQTPPREYKQYFKTQNVYIVFCLTYNIEQNIWGGTSATGMYAFRLDTLYNRYITQSGADIYANPVQIARAIVSGIYGVSATNGYGVATHNDAKVTKAYLIPKDLIITSSPSVISVTSKSMYGTFDSNHTLAVYDVINYNAHKDFTININPNYNYYVGTVNKGLKVTRDTSGATVITYGSIINNNDIQVIVKQGDNQQYITSEFEIDLTMNDGDVTNLSGIKQALKTGLTVVQGVAGGDYFKLGTQLAGETISMIGNHYYGRQIGNGDGVSTFIKLGNASIGLGVGYPYGYVTCESTTDEQVNARNKGAFYDCYVSTLANIFTYSFIGTGTNNDATFVQAKVCIDNIPLQAITEISTRLNKGVYLVKL